MSTKRKLPQIWSLLLLIALIAAACSGGADTVADATDAAEAVFDAVDGDDSGDSSFDEEEVESEAFDDLDDGRDDAVPTAAQATDAPASERLSASGSTTAAQTTAELGRDIIFTAAVTIEVDDVETTGRQATEAIDDLGGFVFGEDSTGGAQPTTTLIFKVRPDDFAEALEALGGIGELRSQRVTTDDVTERVVDLQSRITTTELGVERLRAAMEGATNLEDFARLEEQLLSRESDLEVLRGTLRTLRDQIDLATITLTIVQDRVTNGIEVATSRYEGHDAGAGCPGTGNSTEPGDEVTVCFELINTGDQTLTDVTLTDTVLDIDNEDLAVVFGDPDDLQPGQSLMLALDLTPERTVNLRVTVTGTPTDGTSTEAAGQIVRTNLSPRIGVDRSSVSAGFGDGFEAGFSLLGRVWAFAQVFVGFLLPLLVLLPFAWLALKALGRLRQLRGRGDGDENEQEPEFQPPPPAPSVASA